MKILKKTREGVTLSYRKGDQPTFMSWADFDAQYTIRDGYYPVPKTPTMGDIPALKALAESYKRKERRDKNR